MKPIIYQLIPRLWTNLNDTNRPSGTIEENGSGKLNDITPRALESIKELGATHVLSLIHNSQPTRPIYM